MASTVLFDRADVEDRHLSRAYALEKSFTVDRLHQPTLFQERSLCLFDFGQARLGELPQGLEKAGDGATPNGSPCRRSKDVAS